MLGLQIQVLNASTGREIDAALATLSGHITPRLCASGPTPTSSAALPFSIAGTGGPSEIRSCYGSSDISWVHSGSVQAREVRVRTFPSEPIASANLVTWSPRGASATWSPRGASALDVGDDARDHRRLIVGGDDNAYSRRLR